MKGQIPNEKGVSYYSSLIKIMLMAHTLST